jgi:HEAT repeat protein
MVRVTVASLSLAVATTLVAAAGAFAQAGSVQPGEQSRWSLDFSARMEQTSAHPIEVHMMGRWMETVSAVRGEEYDSELQLADLHFAGDAVKDASPEVLASLKARLSRPFWATYRNDGELLQLHFYRDMTASDRNLLQMVATEVQFVRPDAAQANWTAQERDGAGEYTAQYETTQPDRIVKHKVKYLYTDGVAGAPANAVRISVENSEITFVMGPDHRVQAVDGSNRMSMNLTPDKQQQLQAVTRFHLSNLQAGSSREQIGSLERAHPDVFDSPIVTQRPDASAVRAETDDRLLKGYETDSLLAAAFSKDGNSATLRDRLAALFRSRPEAAGAAAELLIQHGSQRGVTNALGAAGSPTAVAALSSLAHNEALPEELRVDALVAFVQTQHPSLEAMRVPRDLMNDADAAIRSAARMMSGALSRAGRQEHGEESDAIDAVLMAMYRDAGRTGGDGEVLTQETNQEKTREWTQARIELLGALGNSAGPSVIPAIEEALNDPQTAVRASAARALRLANGTSIDRLLASVITSDSDAAVRSDAIFATRFRRPMPSPIADALLHAASNDAAKFVRSDALGVLVQNPKASPQIPQTLAQIAESDSDAAIRQQAKDALAHLSPEGAARQ